MVVLHNLVRCSARSARVPGCRAARSSGGRRSLRLSQVRQATASHPTLAACGEAGSRNAITRLAGVAIDLSTCRDRLTRGEVAMPAEDLRPFIAILIALLLPI